MEIRKIIHRKIDPFLETITEVPSSYNLLSLEVDQNGFMICFFEVFINDEIKNEIVHFVTYKTDEEIPCDEDLLFIKSVFFFHTFIHVFIKKVKISKYEKI